MLTTVLLYPSSQFFSSLQFNSQSSVYLHISFSGNTRKVYFLWSQIYNNAFMHAYVQKLSKCSSLVSRPLPSNLWKGSLGPAWILFLRKQSFFIFCSGSYWYFSFIVYTFRSHKTICRAEFYFFVSCFCNNFSSNLRKKNLHYYYPWLLPGPPQKR